MGFTDVDFDLARATQEGQARSGSRVQSIAEIMGATRSDSHAKRKAKRDAAATSEQLDLGHTSHHHADAAMPLSNLAAPRPARPRGEQLEFDFFRGGNMSTGYEYFDAVTERLSRQPITQSHRMSAIAVLQYIARHLKWNGYHCEKTAGELAELSGFDRSQMSRILKTLEDVGAIYRVTVGREKAIVVNPEGIFRGKVSDHQDVTARFKFDVIDGGKGRAA